MEQWAAFNAHLDTFEDLTKSRHDITQRAVQMFETLSVDMSV